MAFNKTRYGRKLVLDHLLGRVNSPFSTNKFLALFSADPTELGSLVDELTETGYARINIATLMGDAVLISGQISNAAEITFGPATEDWAEITHAGIMDALVGGNMIYYGEAVTSRVIDNTDTFVIRVGQLTIYER